MAVFHISGMDKFFFLAAFLMLAAVPSAKAEDGLIVAELYTSQGCNSCPPADAMLARLAEQESDVLALSFAVDYWDYLGWKDKFGSPAHTERQRAYNAAFGRRSIYTPQLILNGQHQAVGSRSRAVYEALRDARADRPADAEVRIASDGRVHLSGTAAKGKRVLAVWYSPQETVAIRRGENRGRELSYTNIVLGMEVLSKRYDGAASLHVPMKAMELSGSSHVAVLVQDGKGGPIISADRAELDAVRLAAK